MINKIMKLKQILAVFATGLMLASCGADKVSEVAGKISSGEALTEADYTVMIDYCGRYAEQAQLLQDKIDALDPSTEEAGKLTDEVADLTQKNKYLGMFSDKISSATEAEIGAANVEKVKNYSTLMWFSAPEWAEVQGATDIEGSIVDMPDSDSAGVIAEGVGEAVE